MHFSIIAKEIYFTIVVSSATVLAGIGYGFPAQVIPQLQALNDIEIKESNLSWIATSGMLFRPVGAFLDLFLIDILGRRGILRVMALVSAVGWILTALSTNELILCIGRAITSLATGMLAAPLTYVTEMTEAHHRAVFLQISSSCMLFGTELIYLLNTFFHWRIASGIISVYCILFLLSLYTVPESCQWYILRNRTIEAKESYKWTKNCDEEFAKEKIQQKVVDSVAQDNDEKPKSFSEKIRSSNIRKPLLLMIVIHLLRTGLGYEVFSEYAVNTISELHTPYDTNSIVDLFGFINFLFAILTCYLVYKCRKRVLLLSLTFLMSLSIAYVIVSELLRKSTFVPFPFVQIFFFILYMIIASATQQITFGIVPELFPSNCRGTMFCTITLLIFVFIALYTDLYGELGIRVSFLWTLCFFALNCVLFSIFVLLYMPETKNKSLSEIEKYFDKKSNNTKITKIEMPIRSVKSVD